MSISIAKNAFQFPLQHDKTSHHYNCHHIKQDNKLATFSKQLSLQSFTMTKLQFTYSKFKFFSWPFAFTKQTKMTTTTTNQLLQFRFPRRSCYAYNFIPSHFKIVSLQEIRSICTPDPKSYFSSHLISIITGEHRTASNASKMCSLSFSAVDLVCCEVKINCTVGAARKGNLIGQTISYCTGSPEINVDKHYLK